MAGYANLDPTTRNAEVGIIMTESHKIPAYDTDFGFYATIIKAASAGTIVWNNKYTDEKGAWNFEAGETYMIGCTSILTGPETIDSQSYSTTVPAADIWIGATCSSLQDSKINPV